MVDKAQSIFGQYCIETWRKPQGYVGFYLFCSRLHLFLDSFLQVKHDFGGSKSSFSTQEFFQIN
jgi:hypothetical protein